MQLLRPPRISRAPVRHILTQDTLPIAMFNNQSILVTGGTGSFGRAFIHTVLMHQHPRRVVVFSRDELKQFEMSQLRNSRTPGCATSSATCATGPPDAGDAGSRLRGPRGCAQAGAGRGIQSDGMHQDQHPRRRERDRGGDRVRVAKVVALSTDKAANPINLYGATKLASDKLFVAANNMVGSRDIRFSVVRYGNVVGSRGSVVPFFMKLLADGARSCPSPTRR